MLQSLALILRFFYDYNTIKMIDDFLKEEKEGVSNFMLIDTDQYFDQKIDSATESKYTKEIEIISNSCVEISETIPCALRDIYNIKNRQFLIFSMKNLDAKLQTVKWNMDLFSKTLYKFIDNYEKTLIDKTRYNMVFFIGLIAHYNNKNTKDYVHMNLLILLKNGNTYNFFRFDPWGDSSFDINQISGNSFNEMFKTMLTETISYMKVSNQNFTYTPPQNLGENIQTIIEQQNLVGWDGLCMFICNYIYTIINPYISNPYIINPSFGSNDYIVNNVINIFKTVCKQEKFQDFTTERNTFLSNSIPNLGNYITVLKFRINNMYNSKNIDIYNEILTLFGDNQQLQDIDKYNLLQQKLKNDDRYKYIIDFINTGIDFNTYMILLSGLNKFDMMYDLIMQYNSSYNVVNMFLNKKRKNKDQYCDEINLCKENLTCMETNDSNTNVFLDLNRKIYKFFLDPNVPMKNCTDYINRNALNEEEKLHIQTLNEEEKLHIQTLNEEEKLHIQTLKYVESKLVPNNYNIQNVIDYLKQSFNYLKDIDKRFSQTYTTFTQINNENPESQVQKCKLLFKMIYLDNISFCNRIIQKSLIDGTYILVSQTFRNMAVYLFFCIYNGKRQDVEKYFEILNTNYLYRTLQVPQTIF
jgi:hypothetical protein